MRGCVAFAGLAMLAAPAAADDAVIVPPGAGPVPHVLYLDRCPADCAVSAAAVDDARTDASAIAPAAGTLTRMPRLDLVWAELVLCVGQTLGPYDVEVTTEEPAAGTDYAEVKIAGLPTELGFAADLRGAAPMASDCSPLDHGLAFVFSNIYDLAAEPERAIDLCSSVIHQVGHLWGLGDTTECRDAMGAVDDCAPRRWFADLEMPCGAGDCACGDATQDSHRALLDALGAGADPPPPHVAIESPDDGASVGDRVQVFVDVESGRPLDRIELHVAGTLVAQIPGDDSGSYALVGDVDHGDDGTAVALRAFDNLDRLGGDTVVVTEYTGSCSAGGGGAAWPLLVVLALTSLFLELGLERGRLHSRSR